ncbi:MAG: hypothetical protein M1827_000395 [Pycnora praestabilis]|nr:MAG: hypothetical protein M1827_000395 [Pycnora praestabilis]
MSSDFPAYDDRQMHPLSPVSNIGDPTVVGATGMTPTGGAIEALEQGVELKRRRPSNNSQHHVTLRTRHIEDHEANFSTNHTLKKRRRSSLSAPSSTTEENGSMPRQEQSNRLARASLPSTIFQSSNWRSVYGLDASRFNREVDPIQVDPGLALQLMDLFFGHTASMFHIVPQKHFMHWVRRGRKKSAADLMVIYAILAMGTVFSPHAEAKGSGETFASIARNAIEMNCRTFSLQLVQSRILLAAYDFAFGNFRESWNGSILGLGVISGLKLNLEEGIAGLAKGDDYAYGLNKYAFMECCRRTYWSTYMIDRFNAFCTCRPSIIHDEDIFLRLPCTDGDFEEQRETDNPLFDKKVIDQQHSTEGDQAMQGIISHLIQISSILGDVISNAYRSAHGSIFGYAKAYEEFREQTHERLRLWVKKLPHHLMFSMINMTACIKNGHIDTFICMHAMYHVTLMNLNRSVHPKRLERSLTDRNIQEANDHAYQTLYLMRDVDRLLRDKDFSNTNCTLSNPFIGYAVTAAIEIISVVGTRDQIPSVLGLVNGALPVMEGLSTIWASAKGQLTSILNRLQELPETNMSRGSTRINDNDMFAVKNRLEATTKLEDDLIYATLKEDYVRAMELRNDVESVSYR